MNRSRPRFGLAHHPVVLHGGEQVTQQRVDAAGVTPEDAHPIDTGKAVGQLLGTLEVTDVYEDAVALLLAHAVAIEPAGHPLVAVHVDLERKGEPRLALLIALIPAVALMSLVVIPREERYLEARFPSEYLRYKASVRRWL